MAGLGLFFRRRAISSDPVTNPLKDYVFYEKLKGDGVAYINTGYYPNSRDNISVEYDKVTTATLQVILASRENVYGKQLMVAPNSSMVYVCRFYPDSTPNYLTSAEKIQLQLRIDESLKKEAVVINGKENTAISRSTAIDDYNLAFPMLIYAGNTIGSAAMDSRLYQGSIYSLIITNAETGEVKKDFRPCTFKGEPGMYEAVEGVFYPNSASSGQFTPINRKL